MWLNATSNGGLVLKPFGKDWWKGKTWQICFETYSAENSKSFVVANVTTLSEMTERSYAVSNVTFYGHIIKTTPKHSRFDLVDAFSEYWY